MSREPMRALEEQLGGDLASDLAALSESEVLDLAEAIQTTRRRQARALDEAGGRALGRIPRLLRGPIRKIVS